MDDWRTTKRAYLRGLEVRAKLGAFDAHIAEGMRSNIFSTYDDAVDILLPDTMTHAALAQDFSDNLMRTLTHAAVRCSWTPVLNSMELYRFLYYNHGWLFKGPERG